MLKRSTFQTVTIFANMFISINTTPFQNQLVCFLNCSPRRGEVGRQASPSVIRKQAGKIVPTVPHELVITEYAGAIIF